MKKRFISKKKLIGTLASTVALAAPLVLAPSQFSHAYDEGELPSVSLDKIHTIVLPKNGSKYIDFNALYDATYFDVDIVFEDEQSTERPVSGIFTLENQGYEGYEGNEYDWIYEIKANDVGTATFTVTGERYIEEVGHITITDTFNVIVVENSEDPDDYKFDITNAVDLLKQSNFTQDQVIDVLENISPLSLQISDPFDYNIVNTAPIQAYPSSSYFSVKEGEQIHSGDIQERVSNYFKDKDYYYEEGNEVRIYDSISLVSIESNADFSVSTDSEGDRIYDYSITPLKFGDLNLDVVVTDHKGGFTKGQIPIHIEQQYKSNSVLAKHFNSPELNYPVLYLSNDAEINLTEIFYDAETNLYDYKLVVEYTSGNTVETEIDIPNNAFSWQSLMNLQYGVTKIKQLRAYNSQNTLEEPMVLNVDIERTDKDPFPQSLNLYQSIQDVGVSSYILDYRSSKGFNDPSVTINNSDIQNYAQSRVTAAVYQDHYLKFDAGYGSVDWTTKMKVYAHDSKPERLYLDDFNFNLVSAEQTMDYYSRPAIHITRLYPDYQSSWDMFYGHINEYVSLNTPTYINFGYVSGALTAHYGSGATQGTSEVMKIDPYNGASVFYVPFQKR
ncbi:hypothetical protein PAECIP111891_01302 [Paenibacillus allorhizoplanae]|uniref:DUF4179 domain-containing protein n=1 Tax=Paenibacillus allorhizoplanae TaxID=2905648 RepID=A0ABN8G992_9BACL|nr:hypothetical protein [Paenibacillus allorhizoplanae]CAH1199538.1 hypothetical protein PAECIP111891_01302 [Paenibacillus allorhizoplanae]